MVEVIIVRSQLPVYDVNIDHDQGHTGVYIMCLYIDHDHGHFVS
jgi:hypothetical protein